MKYLFLLMYILFLTNVTNAQNFSFGFNYSGQITSNNYEFASMYTIEGDYGFFGNTFSTGFSASIIRARINKDFIDNPIPDSPFETTFKLALQGNTILFYFKRILLP